MRDISRRINKVEKRLNLDKKQIIVIIKDHYGNESFGLSEPVEQWLTYPEAIEDAQEQNGIIVLSESKEILARKEQLNALKVQGNV